MKDHNKSITTLDVRPLLAKGQEPLPHILSAATALEDGASLKLLTPFEPLPLYLRMDEMGFTHQTQNISDGSEPLWQILFSKKDASAPVPSTGLRTLNIRNTPPDSATAMINQELNALAYDDVLKVEHNGPLPLEPDTKRFQWKSLTGDENGATTTRIWRRN